MKTNFKKITSLFLSLLMVLGTVISVLPTTVFAAETKSVTVLGVDGTTELVRGTYSVGSVIDLVRITGLSYKNTEGEFLTFVDGEGKIHKTDYMVTDDVTLTATYQKVKGFFTGADLVALPSSRVHVHTYSVSSVTKDDGNTYYRITAGTTAAGGVGFYFTEEEAFTTTADGVTIIDATADFVNWKIRFQMFRKLNNYDSRLDSCSYTSDFYETITDGESTTYHLARPFTHADYVNAGNTKVYGYRIGPWGFETTSRSDIYYDIKCIASFDSEAVALVFDYDKYTYNPASGLATVTFKDNSGLEVKNIKAVLGRYKDEIDFAYDFHTDPEGFPGWGSYLLVYPNGVYDFFSDRLKEICDYLDNKNFVSKGITIKKAFRGDDLSYPSGSGIDVNATPNYSRQNLSSSSSSVIPREQ